MSENLFWSLKHQIDEELHAISLTLSNLTEADFTDAAYLQISRQLDTIQELFDKISEAYKELDLSQTNPNLIPILEANQHLNANYGDFHRLRRIFYNKFARFRNNGEDVIDRHVGPSEEESEDLEQMEELPDEEEPELLDDVDPDEEKKQKQKDRKKRQDKLAAEARKRDMQRNAERLKAEDIARRQEAQRLGMSVSPEQGIAEATLVHEWYRQEEARIAQQQAEEARIASENEAFRRTKERLDRAESFESIGSQHIDLTPEGLKQEPQPESPVSSHEDIPPAFEQKPAGSAPDSYENAPRPSAAATEPYLQQSYQDFPKEQTTYSRHPHEEGSSGVPVDYHPSQAPEATGDASYRYEPSKYSEPTRPESAYEGSEQVRNVQPSESFVRHQEPSYSDPPTQQVYSTPTQVSQTPSAEYGQAPHSQHQPDAAPGYKEPDYQPSAPVAQQKPDAGETYDYEPPKYSEPPSSREDYSQIHRPKEILHSEPVNAPPQTSYIPPVPPNIPASSEPHVAPKSVSQGLGQDKQEYPQQIRDSGSITPTYRQPQAPESKNASGADGYVYDPFRYTDITRPGFKPSGDPAVSEHQKQPEHFEPSPAHKSFVQSDSVPHGFEQIKHPADTGYQQNKEGQFESQKVPDNSIQYEPFSLPKNGHKEIWEPKPGKDPFVADSKDKQAQPSHTYETPKTAVDVQQPSPGAVPKTEHSSSAPHSVEFADKSHSADNKPGAGSDPSFTSRSDLPKGTDTGEEGSIETVVRHDGMPIQQGSKTGSDGKPESGQRIILPKASLSNHVPGSVQTPHTAAALPEDNTKPAGGVKQTPFIPRVFTPEGTAPHIVSQAPTPATCVNVSSNAALYATLVTNREMAKDGPLIVSPAVEIQMRFNVEKARLACMDAMGTDRAPEIVHEYYQQRKYFSEFKSALKNGKITVSQPITPPSPVKSEDKKGSGPAVQSSVYSAFTPDGIQTQVISNGKSSGIRYRFDNPGVRRKPVYTPENPMVVSVAYEQAMNAQMQKVSASLNASVSQGKPIAPSLDVHKMKVYTDAYLAFQAAKKEGTVVVSSDHSALDTPDYLDWQQRRLAQKAKAAPKSSAFHVTAQSVGPNLNKTTKKTVEEAVANIFNQSSKLKQQSVVSFYAHKMGSRFQQGAAEIGISFRDRIYRTIQDGEDNPIRSFEQGRYYVTTAAGVVLAIQAGAPTKALERSIRHASSREFKLYGTKSLLTSGQLSSVVNNNVRITRELDERIRELEERLTPLYEKMDLFLQSNPGANKLDALDKFSRREFEKLSSELKALRGQKSASLKDLTMHKKLQELKHQKKLEEELLEKIKKKGNLPRTEKQLQKAAEAFNQQFHAELKKKYGDLVRYTDKSLSEEILRLKKQGADLKKQIKLLQAKGSALTAAERRLLSELKEKTKSLGKDLSKHISLSKERLDLAFMNKRLDEMLKAARKNAGRIRGGLMVVQNYMVRALNEGHQSGTDGIARVVQISANRHVRTLVKGVFKASYRTSVFLVKSTMNLVSPGSVDAISNAVFIAKTGVKAKVGVATHTAKETIKTAVRTGVHTAGKAVGSVVPEGIKTGVKSGVQTAVAAGKKVSNKYAALKKGVSNIRNAIANSKVGKAAAAVRRGAEAAAEAAKAAASFLKAVGIKGLLIMFGIFLLLALIPIIMTAIGGAASGVIASPYMTDDKKIDLTPYVDIIKEKERNFVDVINSYQEDDEYDNVYIEYSGVSDNTKEMLSMMAVRMSQDLDLEKNKEIEKYLQSLYEDSHTYTTSVHTFKCSGCQEIVKTEVIEDPETGESVEVTTSEMYCPGHKELTVTISVLGFDEIFTADSYEYEEGSAVAGESLGTFTITHYCCEKYEHICNAGPPYETASGTTPTPNRTIAVDPDVIPLGTHVIIDGQEYIAEDTGGAINGNRIDICVEKHSEALELGTKTATVYLAAYEGEGIKDTGKWEGWNEDNIEWCKVIYDMDWADIYAGVEIFTSDIGTDISGVEFVDGDRPGCQGIIDIAMGQLGYKEGSNNDTKFGDWYGLPNQPWCAMFVSWCANEYGVLDTVIPRYADCDVGVKWFRDRGQWARPGDIVPVAGDIIFFDYNANGMSEHTGLVVGSDADYVYTIEGNSGDAVKTWKYSLNDSQIMGYGLPNY